MYDEIRWPFLCGVGLRRDGGLQMDVQGKPRTKRATVVATESDRQALLICG